MKAKEYVERYNRAEDKELECEKIFLDFFSEVEDIGPDGEWLEA